MSERSPAMLARDLLGSRTRKRARSPALGSLPAHWNELPLKRLVDPKRPITYGIVQCGPDVKNGVPYIRPVDMLDEHGVNPDRLQRTAAEIAHQYGRSVLAAGDLVVSIGPSFGKVMSVPDELAGANLTQGTARIAPRRGVHPPYLFWSLRSPATFQAWDAGCSGATFRALTLELLSETLHPLPPLAEQVVIAEFLGRETPKIDRVIEAKQYLIELLDEKRAALVVQAVTKGLNPDTEMKDSGVAWLGTIPAHWRESPLQHLTEPGRPIMYGIVLPGPNAPEGVPIVKGGDVKPGRLRIESLSRTTVEIESKYGRSRLREGDLVYAIRGSIGEVEKVPEELTGANLTQDAARVSVDAQVSGDWLLFALRSRPIFAQLEVGALGATIRGINIRDLKRVVLPVPPKPEQEAIAAFLGAVSRDIANLIREIESGIQLLREHRTALISAAVTGKIDVREHAT